MPLCLCGHSLIKFSWESFTCCKLPWSITIVQLFVFFKKFSDSFIVFLFLATSCCFQFQLSCILSMFFFVFILWWQGERGPPGVNGTQGFQGCPGPRGVKVKTLKLTSPYNLNSCFIVIVNIAIYLFNTIFYICSGWSWVFRRKGECFSFLLLMFSLYNIINALIT